MKTKLISVAIATLFLLTSCNNEEPVEISFSDSAINAPAEGGSYKIAVKSNTQWWMGFESSWCSVEGGYKTGNDTIYINILKNESNFTRETGIMISNSKEMIENGGGLGLSGSSISIEKGKRVEIITRYISIHQVGAVLSQE